MKTAIAAVMLVALGGVASADKDKDKADALFKQGKKLMAEKKFSDACQAFEQSYKLDPGIGGELNIARCYEEWGKLGRAYRAYKAADQQAKDAQDSREPKIHDLLEALDARVPRLTLRVPDSANTDGVTVTIDGATVDPSGFNQAQLVDPGPHVIEYQAPGGAKKKRVVPVERGGNTEIALDLPSKTKPQQPDGKPDKPDRGDKSDKPDKPDKADRPNEPTEQSQPGHGQRVAGIVIGSAGVVAMVVSGVVSLSARSSYSSALSADCNHMTNDCDPAGLTATHDARHDANIGTAVMIGGVALVGAGVVVYLLAPHAMSTTEHALYVVPSVGPSGGGIALGGRL